MLLLSCNNEKKQYIELTLGSSMDPNEPRIGILIDDKDSLYMCKEIIGTTNKNTKYEYFKSTKRIDFSFFKQNVLNSFDTLSTFRSVPDAQSKQINYYLNGQNEKFRFYSHELSKKQEKIIEDLILLQQSKTFVKIPHYNFSKELLYEVTPLPPQ
ncbi:hypothetical protein [Chryseobacterium sp. 3008163]|uniref:hypothetical protein n=1 Tax=Chryseobacterium sp. 3008163 TaxID=2478663 RepID=UPI001013CBBD|nr:hypothetical protein [Chryseobacterium sp. 3008163]